MIIGTSMDAKVVDVYRNTQEPFDIVEVDWVNQERLYGVTNGCSDSYEFVEERIIPCVDDEWHQAMDFSSETMNLLIECDYCGDKFTTSWLKRREKATNYLGHFNGKTGSQKVNDELIDLYKDNCTKCTPAKRRETTMINNGYWHPSHSEEHKELMRNVFIMHNMVPTSRGQRYIAKLLNAELNVSVGYYFADMILDNKIVIEYDGGGHNLSVLRGSVTQEEFDKEELIRSNLMFSKGYKMIRVISPEEYFPADEKKFKATLCDAIAELYLSDRNEIHIKFSNKVNDPVHGKLEPIKKILEKSEWGADIL